MKNREGFIQIPILITIVVSVLFLSGGGYLGVKKYQSYQSEKIEKQKITQAEEEAKQKSLEEIQRQKDLEVDKLKKEVEALKNRKPQVIQQTIVKEMPTPKADNDLPSIIQEWRPRIAYIECILRDASTISGSGLIAIFDGPFPQVLTNRHVIRDEYGNVPPGCVVKLPDNNEIFEIVKSNDIPVSEIVDVGALNIRNPNDQLINLVSSSVNYCFPLGYVGKAAIGEPIVILGYPYTGAKYDVTATEGIISGYDGDYYITSAKVEHGNSGGVAILVKDNCYLGIPTYVKVGTSETLARILDVNSKYIFYNK